MADERKIVNLEMLQSGYDCDGVVELFMIKPLDNKKVQGKAYLPQTSISIEPQESFGRITNVQVEVTIEEDPRLKSFVVFNTYTGNGFSVIKHGPEVINAGEMNVKVASVKGEQWNEESDLIGEGAYTPYVLEFNTAGGKIGMIRGIEERYSYNNPRKLYIFDRPETKTYYELADHWQKVRLFRSDTQGFQYTTGTSLLDKINQRRYESGLMALTADKNAMSLSEAYADYMRDEDWCFAEDENETDITTQIKKYNVINYSEHIRLVFCKRRIDSRDAENIDLPSIYEEAITYWIANDTVTLMRESINSAGFGIKTVNTAGRKVNIYICVDLFKMDGIGTRQTSTEMLEIVENMDSEKRLEYEARKAGYRYGTDYAFETANVNPKFALNSRNPLCNTFIFTDSYPIPSSKYVMYGFFNDVSVLSHRPLDLIDMSNWSQAKINQWQEAFGNQLPSLNPVDYPVFLQEEILDLPNLKGGTIDKVKTGETGEFTKYDIKVGDSIMEDVQSFSNVTYEVGRWVIIHGPHKVESDLGGETTYRGYWYVAPSSSAYYKNVKINPEGMG